MDARRRADGTFAYRYKLASGAYVALGADQRGRPLSGLHEAKRRALEIEAGPVDFDTIAGVARRYFASPMFAALAERTKRDYLDYCWPQLERRFGHMTPDALRAADVARYLRVERADAPVRANREVALLSTLFQFAIEAGEATGNPCRQVRRNKERPRTHVPEPEHIEAFVRYAEAKGESSLVVALLGLAVAFGGARRAEILAATQSAVTEAGLRLREQKTTGGKEYLIEWGPQLRAAIERALELARRRGSIYLFPNRAGVPYTEAGFKAMWSKIMADYVAAGGTRFRAHDLRAYFVTRKLEAGENPETHIDPATTRRVYDRRRTVRRGGL